MLGQLGEQLRFHRVVLTGTAAVHGGRDERGTWGMGTRAPGITPVLGQLWPRSEHLGQSELACLAESGLDTRIIGIAAGSLEFRRTPPSLDLHHVGKF